MEMPKKEIITERNVPHDCKYLEQLCNEYLKKGYSLWKMLYYYSDLMVEGKTILRFVYFKLNTSIYKEDSPYYIAIPPKFFKCISYLPPDIPEEDIKNLHNMYPEYQLRHLISTTSFNKDIPQIAIFSVF